jgi:hypothetical protein
MERMKMMNTRVENPIQTVVLVGLFHRCNRIFTRRTKGRIPKERSLYQRVESGTGKRPELGELQSKRPNPSRNPKPKKRLNHTRGLEEQLKVTGVVEFHKTDYTRSSCSIQVKYHINSMVSRWIGGAIYRQPRPRGTLGIK